MIILSNHLTIQFALDNPQEFIIMFHSDHSFFDRNQLASIRVYLEFGDGGKNIHGRLRNLEALVNHTHEGYETD